MIKIIIGKKYKHKKRGSEYKIINFGELQWSANPDIEHQIMVVYESLKDGKIWIRPYNEFCDGRFEEING